MRTSELIEMVAAKLTAPVHALPASYAYGPKGPIDKATAGHMISPSKSQKPLATDDFAIAARGMHVLETSYELAQPLSADIQSL